ncbi:MAG TPA: tetratricopeptide repeat protein [Chthonomonadaceae bacterium]|nr:tetratricopeptide repeat protein [Chthonomonadaceae bacterium]
MQKAETREPALDIQLFGPMRVTLHQMSLPRFRSRSTSWLLAMLALRLGRDVAREWLAGSLWPDSEPEQALYNLRRCLSELRQAFGTEADALLTPARQTLRLNREGVRVDVDVFETMVSQWEKLRGKGGRPDEGISEASFPEEALALYHGPLLEDCAEEWALSERRTWEERYLKLLQILTEQAVVAGDTSLSIRALRKMIAQDPLREEAHRALMQALFDAGDIAAITQVYRDLRLLLRRDLNANPSPETEALYRSLQAGARQPTALATPPTSPRPGGMRRLPVPLTALVGRERQIEEVADWLQHGRLVTILGTGGMGKTRLAIAVGEAVASAFPDGVWFVELAALSEPERVAQTVATTLGIPEQPGKSPLETLTERLASRSLLLILDNCEHLAQSCVALAENLLPICSGVHLLATSRHPLGSLGERRYRLPPLEMPPAGRSVEEKEVNTLLEYPGIRLFVERAVMAQPRFRLDRQNASAVLQICHALDGIPLALELAAARMRAMDVDRVAERLRQDLAFLTLGGSAYPQRHRAMNAVIEWSYQPCSESEQTLFRRLSVFADGCTLEAAEAICAGGVVPEAGVLDGLMDLVDRSLVEYLALPGGDRYRMLQPIRTFARAAFEATEERAEVLSRYVAYFVSFVEPRPTGADQGELFNRFDEERDNLRVALAWCQASPEGGESGLRLGGALQMYWVMRGPLSEGREHLMAALGHSGAQDITRERADALNGAGNLAYYQGDLSAAAVLHQESLKLKRELGYRRGVAGSLHNLGNVAWMQGDYKAALSLYEEALQINRELGNRAWEANNLERLGNMAQEQGDYAAARSLLEECLALFRELGDKGGIGHALSLLGNMARYEDDLVSAHALLEESLNIRREIGHKHGIGDSLYALGNLAYSQGDLVSARALLEESLTIYREVGHQWGTVATLINIGSLDKDQGDYAAARSRYTESLRLSHETGSKSQIVLTLEAFAGLASNEALANPFGPETPENPECRETRLRQAARLWGAAQTLRKQIGAPLAPAQQQTQDREVTAARERLGEAQWEADWNRGSRTTLEQAVAFALSES